MPVTITRRTRSNLAIAAAVALALSACSPSNGSDESPSGSSAQAESPSASGSSTKAAAQTSKSASPTPIAASSKGPAKNWPVPKMPAEAKKKTLEGAAAFSDFYFSLIEFTSTTNDTKPIKKYSEKSCEVCQHDVIGPSDRNKKNHAWNAGGEYHPTITAAKFPDRGGALVSFKYDQDKRYVYNAGGEVETIYAKTKSPIFGTFALNWDNGWKVQSINIVES
ncbi:DUF6318 family protein [Arthrobacter sp. JSM 101049]|uniref:DUF6318 family protein n=1 Tax=Arthrobacter sp. JSM 101049 TaxID=929097 RepID=UPI003569968B